MSSADDQIKAELEAAEIENANLYASYGQLSGRLSELQDSEGVHNPPLVDRLATVRKENVALAAQIERHRTRIGELEALQKARLEQPDAR
jgi:hypothetical protein